MNIKTIDLDLIDQNENSRVVYKRGDLAELMLSMKEAGLLQPVGVKKTGDRYEAVFGNRRIMAAKKLGWTEIQAHIVDAKTDNDRDILNLIENIKRKNTTLAEDGRVFSNLLHRGLTIKEICARVGITTVAISR